MNAILRLRKTTEPTDMDENEPKSAVTLLSETSQNGYERMQRAIMQEFNIPEDRLPSYYMMTKSRPRMDKFIVNELEFF